MFSGATSFNQDMGNWDIENVTTMENMFFGVTLSTSNYNSLLVNWSTQNVQNGVYFSGGNSKYSPGDAANARATLEGTYGWTITDGGESNIPAVSTYAVSEITSTTATSGGNVSADGGSSITERGLVWHTSINPTTVVNTGITTDGTGLGTFTSSIAGLAENTTYYVRAYATNGNGTEYGQNIEFTTKNELTISGTFTVSSKTYDGTAAATINTNNLTLDGIVPELNDVAISSVTLAFNDKDVASDKSVTITGVELSGNDAHQYFVELTGAPTALANITAKELTVTADNKTVTYGDAVPTLTYTITGYVNGEDETEITGEPTISTSYTSSTPVASSPVAITAAVNTLTAANYSFVFVNGSITINTKELTIGGTFTVSNREYDGTTIANTATNTLSLIGIVNSDVVALTPTFAFSDKNVGTDKTVSLTEATGITGADEANYTLSLTGAPTATATITAKELIVENAVASDKVYDGNTDAAIAGAELSGVIGDEVVSLGNHTSGVFAQANVGEDIAITVAMSIAGADAGNYTLVQPTTLTADITALELTIGGTFTVEDKIYDGTTSATIATNELTLVTPVDGDDVSLINVVAEFESEAVGKDKAVSITAAELAGDDIENYSLSIAGAPTTTATINAVTYTLTLVVSPEESGTVTGAGSYEESESVAITATANSGYQFVSWKNGETEVSTDANFSYTMPAENVTLTAYFEEIPPETFTVTFTVTDDMCSLAIEGASITINEQTLTTNADGVATIELENGVYPYSITAEGYALSEGSITVDGADVSEDVSLAHVGLDENSLTNLSVFPNPFSNEINIVNAENVKRVVISNIIGEVVMNVELGQASSHKLETNLRSGIYLVTIISNNGTKVIRKMIRK